MEPYLDLSNAIVEKAAEDYASAFMGNSVGGNTPASVMRECEAFFRSSWYETLTNGKIDGDWLMKKLKLRELEKAHEAYKLMLNVENTVTFRATVNFPKGKAVNFIFAPRFIKDFMNTMQTQIKALRAEIKELKKEEQTA